MQLPIDVKAVLDEAMSIDEAGRTPVSATVYVDASCPQDVLELALAALSPQAPHARVAFGSLDDALAAPYPGDDAAVVVAGTDERVGQAAACLRAAGVPAMVLTTLPALVSELAQAAGSPIPDGDVVAPGGTGVPLARRLACAAKGKPQAAVEYDADAAEPAELDEASARQLKERMGAWVVAACREKKLAFALAFPFVRRPLSLEAVGATALQNAGVGLVMFIPGADMPVMTLNQAKMLLQIAAAYGQPMSIARVKELACVVGGAFACRTAARQVAGAVPALGWAVKAAIGYAGTEAMGRAAIEYFEAGGSAAGLAETAARARDAAVAAAGAGQGARAVLGRATERARGLAAAARGCAAKRAGTDAADETEGARA